MIREQMEKIYRDLAPHEIPWNLEKPPGILRDLVTSGKITPCKAVDLGCGTGAYALYLASQGFEVTGIDIAPSAVAMAEEKAAEQGISCRFVVADLRGPMAGVEETFDFAYDWQLLHHIFPGDRKKYVANVAHLLNPDGQYLSVCFSETSDQFGGRGKYRKTPLGTTLYFSSEHELAALFKARFSIEELTTVEIEGKFGPHAAVYALLRKRCAAP